MRDLQAKKRRLKSRSSSIRKRISHNDVSRRSKRLFSLRTIIIRVGTLEMRASQASSASNAMQCPYWTGLTLGRAQVPRPLTHINAKRRPISDLSRAKPGEEANLRRGWIAVRVPCTRNSCCPRALNTQAMNVFVVAPVPKSWQVL